MKTQMGWPVVVRWCFMAGLGLFMLANAGCSSPSNVSIAHPTAKSTVFERVGEPVPVAAVEKENPWPKPAEKVNRPPRVSAMPPAPVLVNAPVETPVATGAASQIFDGPRVALVIGNADYRDAPLHNPVNDAQDMEKVLKDLDFEVVQKEDLDKKEMVEALNDFGERLKIRGGAGLFYYSGHGIQDKGKNYLIPVGANIKSASDLEFEAVDASRLLGKMEETGSDPSIVILDACRNSPFKGWYRGDGDKGLARMDAPTGSIIAYATKPGEVAQDGTGRNSPYTQYLLTAMREPGLKIEDVFKRVRIGVMGATHQRQTPWEESSLSKDFYFVPARTTANASQ